MPAPALVAPGLVDRESDAHADSKRRASDEMVDLTTVGMAHVKHGDAVDCAAIGFLATALRMK